jgi:hypothetical protein
MLCLQRTLAFATIASVLFIVATGAQAAAAQRTFVASYGNDLWPCSLAQPCRGFQAAINAVAAGGEVVALDSAGYGAMEIHKSVSVIVPPGIHAGLSPGTGIPLPGFPGQSTVVLIDIQSTDTVVLRGLSVNQQGTVNGGIHWLSANGGTVHIENTTVNGFLYAGLFMGAPLGQMFVKDSIFRNNGYGIYLRGNLGFNNLSADHVRIENSSSSGFTNEGLGRVSISDSVISGNGIGISHTNVSGTNTIVDVYVNRCTISNNAVTFKLVSAGNDFSEILVAASMIGNTGIIRAGPHSVVISLGNNSWSPFTFDTTHPPE